MIELKNIHKTYLMGKVEVKALDGVTLKIEPGEFVAIMGPSGSGKSTLMHVIGLLDKPSQGEYFLFGKKFHQLTDEQFSYLRNHLMGFIFQQFHLLPRMNVADNTGLPLIYAGKKHLKNRVVERIKEVGLSDRINHNPNELSGGQQQRVAIARALVNDPLIILADEPTGNLDSKSKEEIIKILERLNEQGKTIIVVTHEPEIAAFAKRIIVMRDGKIISDKVTRETEKSAIPMNSDEVAKIITQSRGKIDKAEFTDFIKQAVSAMVSHKARSFLSILGILIGVAAVIAMLALGQGASESIKKQLSNLGSNLLVIRSGSHRMHGVSGEAGAVTRFTFSDVDDIKRHLDAVKKISPAVRGRVQMVYSNSNWNTQAEGVGVDYETMRNNTPPIGRFFSEDELRRRDKVVLLGPTVARELFGENNPVGETVKMNLINFKVIGVLPTKGANTFNDQDDVVMIPITTAMYRLLGKEYIDSIFVEIKDAALIEGAQEDIKKLIIKSHRLKGDEDSFEIRNMSDIRSTLESTTKTMSMLLGSIAAISLLVGGIGIMNIMLVSVTERTKEIGLRKAIGATNHDILMQFLIEAVLMSFIGGILGIALGCGTAVLITSIAKWAVSISIYSIVLATTFSLAIGVLFGLWPARQASRLNPIEALRYE